jgi:hypothetical protein
LQPLATNPGSPGTGMRKPAAKSGKGKGSNAVPSAAGTLIPPHQQAHLRQRPKSAAPIPAPSMQPGERVPIAAVTGGGGGSGGEERVYPGAHDAGEQERNQNQRKNELLRRAAARGELELSKKEKALQRELQRLGVHGSL